MPLLVATLWPSRLVLLGPTLGLWRRRSSRRTSPMSSRGKLRSETSSGRRRNGVGPVLPSLLRLQVKIRIKIRIRFRIIRLIHKH